MNEEEREARKSLFLKIGVFSIFALVFILWLLNLKGVFINISDNSNNLTLDKIGSEIENNAKKDSDRLGLNQDEKKQNDFVDKLLDKTEQVISSSTASSTINSEIKKSLQELTNNFSTSTDKSLGENCPPYIDCMPTIGEARPCVVPPGCENITIIAY
ncbi:MAG: hypothetical protein WAW11_00050 [Patescibacteria group bacterium]